MSVDALARATLHFAIAGMIALVTSQGIGQSLEKYQNLHGAERKAYFDSLTDEEQRVLLEQQRASLHAMQRSYAPTNEQIDGWARTRNFEELWAAYRQARSYDTEGPRVQQRTGDRLKELPGHAKVLSDRIADGIAKKDFHYLNDLTWIGQLGTPEAIHEIGRFLFDDQLAGPDRPEEYWLRLERPPPGHVCSDAAASLILALGDKSPFNPNDPRSPTSPAAVAAMRKWWLSDGAKAYRDWKPGHALPASAATMPSSGVINAKNTTAARTAPQQPAQSPSWAALIGALAALVGGTGFLLWLGLRKRGGGVR